MKILHYSLVSLLLTGCLLQPSEYNSSPEITEREVYEAYLKNIVNRIPPDGEDNPELERARLIEYYTVVTRDAGLAELILDEAVKYAVPPELAFALAFSESSFRPRAVNYNRDSVDRGIFQLNSRSFPELTEEEFFDPAVNVPLGMSYLRYCLDTGGNEVTALAMYNAGPYRVKSSRTPQMTLDYIAKVMDYRNGLAEGNIPEDFIPPRIPYPMVKSVKNVTLLMEQTGKIN